ncbi:hypothetical protein TL08_01375 [Actinoalloteichus hymeniacidonis]|uniref:Uncharacterized protein n=1 Tax=Actinoalloteichus hymeniacidonis TaxID=340345 RepID=A0AAC9HLR5_9PSEU|nr:hypothetical protein TL08_01375 [Actinoalloteichus hymeniacidonis]
MFEMHDVNTFVELEENEGAFEKRRPTGSVWNDSNDYVGALPQLDELPKLSRHHCGTTDLLIESARSEEHGERLGRRTTQNSLALRPQL